MAGKEREVKKIVKNTKTKSTAVKQKATPNALTKKAVNNTYTAVAGKEITATFPDAVGLTAKIAAALASANVNILAATGYSASSARPKATFNLIVSDLAKAEKALEKIGAEDIQTSSVILVEMANQVGALEKISSLIANAGIMIYYFYATTSSGKTATCVIKTADDKKTMKVLNKV